MGFVRRAKPTLVAEDTFVRTRCPAHVSTSYPEPPDQLFPDGYVRPGVLVHLRPGLNAGRTPYVSTREGTERGGTDADETCTDDRRDRRSDHAGNEWHSA